MSDGAGAARSRRHFFRKAPGMTVLIHSPGDDLHADAVRWGLERSGHPFIFWPAGRFPVEQALSARLDAQGETFSLDLAGDKVDLAGVATVWNRRRAPPALSPGLDKRDLAFAAEQSRQHLDAFLSSACPAALWVNGIEAARAEVNKILQLRLARRVGFAVPATLCSNAPDEIRAFFREHRGDVVYKTYKLGVWAEKDGGGKLSVNYTTRVTADSLEDDEALAVAPGIFQERVAKAFEVRTTIMGAAAFSVRIEPSGEPAAAVDWRALPRERLRVRPIETAAPVREKCLAYMRAAGLRFASFDFIVTPDGEYCFLEVNQMGQFLWKEEKVPELPLLDAMCAFLAAGDPDFSYRPGRAPLRLADYLRSERSAELSRRTQPA
jgi:glutathione synthase/RimK-type ligase-like ATP-grasp enzyme